MSAIEPLSSLIGICSKMISKEELLLLEAELFFNICEKLKGYFREHYKNYLRLLKLEIEMEDEMLEKMLLSLVLKDVLSTEEYTIDGIASYTNFHVDVLNEVILGINLNPSATLLRKVIGLHRLVRRDLYHDFMKKIALEYLAVA